MRIPNKLFGWNKAKTVRVHVVEIADFTDFGQATALLRADVPMEEFLKRPEVWGTSGKKGVFGGKRNHVFLQTGEDVVTANEKLHGREAEPDILFELSDEPELFEVADGKYVQDFRTWDDFYNLPAGVSTFTGESAREAYRLARKAEEAGHLVWELNQNRLTLWFSKHWGFAFFALSLIIAACIIIL